MKRLLSAIAITIGFSLSAQADFSGDYAANLWTQTLDGGSIDISGAPLSVTMVSNNIGTTRANQDLTIAATADGTVSFNWSYSSSDSGGPRWDPFGYLLNGSFSRQTANNGANNQSGFVSFNVLAGDVFGFRARTRDGLFGAATTSVTNFTFFDPAAAVVPLPPAVWVMGMAISSLLVMRRRAGGDKIA